MAYQNRGWRWFHADAHRQICPLSPCRRAGDESQRGLVLLVRGSTAKARPDDLRRSWVLRAANDGKRTRIGLGAYPAVSLAEAREKAAETMRQIREGQDPTRKGKARLKAEAEARKLTFGRAVDNYLAKVALPFKSPKNDRTRERALREICKSLNDGPVERITPIDIAAILRPLPRGTAAKTQSALRAVFAYAMVEMTHRGVHFPNPASADLLKAVGHVSQRGHGRHPALDFRRMPEFIRALEAIDTPAARCLRVISLTASRSGAARRMRFDQIDFEARVWRCPAEQMKDSRHRSEAFEVPLSDAALMAIGKPGGSLFVFANDAASPINDMALIVLTRSLRRVHDDWRDPKTREPFVVHGLRSSFRSWAQFQRKDREIAELVLGHRFYGQVERAYARGDLLDERRLMLDAWARHCVGEIGEVIPLRRA
jgi:integrase